MTDDEVLKIWNELPDYNYKDMNANILALNSRLRTAWLAEMKPVAWIEHHKGGDNLVWEASRLGCTPLYALPDAAPSGGQPCPNKEKMGEHACTNRLQCWEPCGYLGHDAQFMEVNQTAAAQEPLPTTTDKPERESVNGMDKPGEKGLTPASAAAPQEHRKAVAWIWKDHYGRLHHLSEIDGDQVDPVLFAPCSNRRKEERRTADEDWPRSKRIKDRRQAQPDTWDKPILDYIAKKDQEAQPAPTTDTQTPRTDEIVTYNRPVAGSPFAEVAFDKLSYVSRQLERELAAATNEANLYAEKLTKAERHRIIAENDFAEANAMTLHNHEIAEGYFHRMKTAEEQLAAANAEIAELKERLK